MSFSYRPDITGVAISNKSIIVLSTIGFGLIGFVLYFLILRRPSSDEDNERQENSQRNVYGEMLDQSDVATLNRAQRRARAKFRMKKARRAAVPENPAEGVDGDAARAAGGGGVAGENDGGNIDLAENYLSRKERQRVAKAMEREERKIYAEEARKWRQNKQSTTSSDCSSFNSNGKKKESLNEERELSLDKIFPRREAENDALSEFLFWESIAKNTKEKVKSFEFDEIVKAQQMIRKMTIREFVERLKQDGSVSIAALADEFGITLIQALGELEMMNEKIGIVGVVDTEGKYIYVSMEMIKLSIKMGQDAGSVTSPNRNGNYSGQM